MNTEVTQFMADMGELLISSPKFILKEENALLDLSIAQANDNLKILEIEVPIKAEVDMNLNLKNEGQRKTAFASMLKDNVMYQELKKGIAARDIEIRKAQVHLSYQRDLFRAYLAIAGIKT